MNKASPRSLRYRFSSLNNLSLSFTHRDLKEPIMSPIVGAGLASCPEVEFYCNRNASERAPAEVALVGSIARIQQ